MISPEDYKACLEKVRIIKEKQNQENEARKLKKAKDAEEADKARVAKKFEEIVVEEDKVVVEEEDEEDTKERNQITTPKVYSFCYLDPKYISLKKTLEEYTDEKLIKFLRQASDRSFNVVNWKENHRRLTRVACSIILNERGIAPEFRDAKSGVTHRAFNSFEEAQESNDRQIIDLHWIYIHHLDAISPTDWNDSYLKKYEFDFQWATEFVSNARPMHIKIKRLGIPIKIQKLLLTMRGQDVLIKQKNTRVTNSDIRELLFNKISEHKTKLTRDQLEVTCAAIRCLSLAEGSPTIAAEYWKKMPLYLTNDSPKNILPWMKSRKVMWIKFLGEIKSRKYHHINRGTGIGMGKGRPEVVAEEVEYSLK